MKISDFQAKDVINIVNGKKLGNISDIELDPREGTIDAIVVPQIHRIFGLFGSAEAALIIPWNNIVKIGEDVVLVRVEEIKSLPGSEHLQHRA